MSKRGRGESLVVEVRDDLRSAIFDRHLGPGERLRPAELAQRWGVGIGVVREALNLLAADGLVQVARNRGFHVVTLSAEDLTNLTEARKIIEGAALRLSVAAGGVDWESAVIAAHHRPAREPMYLPEDPSTRSRAWADAHLAFHRALIDACDNPVLHGVCEQLSDGAELYRAWSGNGGQETSRDVEAEHRGLMEAAVAHDPDLAVARFCEHIDRTRQVLLELERSTGPAGSEGARGPGA